MKFDWAIREVQPHQFRRSSVIYRRSGGVSRARLAYRVMLWNQRRDGRRYELVVVRVA